VPTLGFIFNPASNRSRSNHVLDLIYEYIKFHQLNARVHVLDPQERIADVAARMSHRYEVVVGCGGDGTVRATAEGLLGTDATMGILPVGSGNDFVKSLGIPDSIESALEILRTGKVRHIDVGVVNGHIFVNTLGIGFDGETNRRTQECEWLKGSPMYIWAALKSNFAFKPQGYRIHINGEVIEQDFLMITTANGKIEGGHFLIAPQADPSDGLLNVVTLDPIPPYILPFHLLRFMNGSHLSLKQVRCHTTKSLIIEQLQSQPVPAHADGEQIELTFPLQIQIQSSVISVLVPSA
jgi:diacylglycerol kinase (ATP)